MRISDTVNAVGKTFPLVDPRPGNGVPEHLRGFSVRIIESLCDGYVRCMAIPPYGTPPKATHSILIHPSAINDNV